MASPLANAEPSAQDFSLWVAGRTPHHAPRMAIPNIPSDTELVSQPFFQGVTSHGATGVDLYRDPKNHADAVATILSHAAKGSKFFPSQGLENQGEPLGDYNEKISTFPGFLLIFNEQSSQLHTSTNIDDMIRDIKKAYDGVLDVDQSKMIGSIERMANSIMNYSSNKAGKCVFTQMVIAEANGYLVTTIFYTTLNMEINQSGKKTYSSQSYYVNRAVFRVFTASLVSNAVKLSELVGDGSLEQWVKDLSSPTGSKISCFEKEHRATSREL